MLLMTPGPTRVPDRVLRAGAAPMIHHRSPEFSRMLGELVARLAPIFGTRSIVLPVHTTGRGAMEAVICNLFQPGDEIAVCANGRFGELWGTVAASHGLVVHRVATDWSRDIDLAEVDTLVRARPAIRAIAMTYCDTSTGVENDVRAIARLAASHGRLTIVDGVSALGGMPFALDEWGVDAAITASQKCLMSAPGVAFAALSERGWAETTRATLPRGYWDFQETRRGLAGPKPMPPGTPPIHTMLQVVEALRAIEEEGLDRVFDRHRELSARAKTGVARLGLSLQCPSFKRHAPTLTAVAMPAGVDPAHVRDGMRARGIEIAAGLGPFEKTAVRIGHMGDIRLADIDGTIAALAEVMNVMQTPERPAAAR
jgi:aspartate aminotransferase-like enzyme